MARRDSASLDKQLQLIGSIAATWNDLDDSANYVLERCLRVPPELFMHVATRINGFDGKKEIIKLWAKARLEANAKDALFETLNAASTVKTYRDAIIHTIPDEFEPDRGKTVKTQARVLRIDISPDTLERVLTFSKLVNAEMLDFVDFTLSMMLQDEYPSDHAEGGRSPEAERHELLLQVQKVQSERKALPALPPLPPARPAPEDFEES